MSAAGHVVPISSLGGDVEAAAPGMSALPILLVEDNPDDEALTVLAFRKNRIANEIVVAHDGIEALDILFGRDGRTPLRPRVVLLDLNLPGVHGLDVLRRIRSDASKATLPVVVLTSSKEEQDMVSGYQLGCNSYIQKPVDFDQFVEAARQLGLYWLLLNQYPDLHGTVA